MPRSLPLFPLTTALVPGLLMPLHIFEPRYRGLVEDLLRVDDPDQREFAVVAVREGHDVHREGLAAVYPVGTTVLLREAVRLDDGRFDIVTAGHRRFRIHDLDTTEPLVRATIDDLEDVTGALDDVLARQVSTRFAQYRRVLGGHVDADDADDADDPGIPDDPTVLGYLVTAAMMIPTDERQRLLAADSTSARLIEARRLLTREIGLVSILAAVPALDSLTAAPSAN